jgi:hypothetical protein
MTSNGTDQYKPLSWQTRRVLVRSLLAELCVQHRHQLALRVLRAASHKLSTNTLASLVLEHGIGRHGAPLSRGIRKLADRGCYAHATALMLRDQERFIYCEGYALTDQLAGAANHAWVLDRENGDHVVDNTWAQPEAAVYLGVPLAPGFARQFMPTGYGVLNFLWQPALTPSSEYWLFPDVAALPRDFTRASVGPPRHRAFKPKLVT